MEKIPFIKNAIIEITKESGEVVKTINFKHEGTAHEEFEKLEMIKSPLTYESLTMNLSEHKINNIGSVRVVAVSRYGERFIRRELYRKP